MTCIYPLIWRYWCLARGTAAAYKCHPGSGSQHCGNAVHSIGAEFGHCGACPRRLGWTDCIFVWLLTADAPGECLGTYRKKPGWPAEKPRDDGGRGREGIAYAPPASRKLRNLEKAEAQHLSTYLLLTYLARHYAPVPPSIHQGCLAAVASPPEKKTPARRS